MAEVLTARRHRHPLVVEHAVPERRSSRAATKKKKRRQVVSLLALLVQHAASTTPTRRFEHAAPEANSQFTCFTSTTVHFTCFTTGAVLSTQLQKGVLREQIVSVYLLYEYNSTKRSSRANSQFTCFTSTTVQSVLREQIVSLLALLVQQYKTEHLPEQKRRQIVPRQLLIKSECRKKKMSTGGKKKLSTCQSRGAAGSPAAASYS